MIAISAEIPAHNLLEREDPPVTSIEQRKFQRFSDNSVVVFFSDAITGEGRLDNVSLGGAAILSNVAMSRGEYLTLTITLPTQAGAIEVELAPVRWVKEGSFLNSFAASVF